MSQQVRVRFAPSPTGNLHIGGLRAALFNWLYARHNDGKFLVRIEDTDLERSKPEFVTSILKALEWTDLSPDEPVVTQSDLVATHKKLLQKLLDEGKAYKCYCPNEVTEESFSKYAKKCRILADPSSMEGKPYVIRLRLPDQETISFHDLIRGDITFDMDQYDDFIIARSDGSPVYNFVVVCDDHAMGITQVIRGEDHIGNTPKQIFLYQALGLSVPQFAHLPLILNEAGGRLSKRDGATNVIDYKEQGFLPEALFNYLVRLGWSHGDQEIFTRKELVELFTLEGVGKKGSIFDRTKLLWMNGMYMREMSADQLRAYIQKELDPQFVSKSADWSVEKIDQAVDLFKQRTETVQELLAEVTSFYHGDATPSEEELAKFCNKDTPTLLAELINQLETLPIFELESVKKLLKDFTQEKNIKLVAIAQPIRLALTGKSASPGVFDLVAVLGKDDTVKRLKQFIRLIS